MGAIRSGDEFGAAAEAGRGFESIRDFAMTPSGRPEIERDINALEEHYYANPSTSIQQEHARQTTLATLNAAINIGDVRKQGLVEAREAVARSGEAIDVNGAVEAASQRAAAEKAALAAADALHHEWVLTATAIPLEPPLPEHITDPVEFAALRYRLENALPGDTFEVTAGGETLAVKYDERFETDTGRTTYVLELDTPTSHSEQTFISKEHITEDVRAAVFANGAWADRRTATNPKLANVLSRDYDKGLVEAAKAHTRQFDDFHAEYAKAFAEVKAAQEAGLASGARVGHARPRGELLDLNDKMKRLNSIAGGRLSRIGRVDADQDARLRRGTRGTRPITFGTYAESNTPGWPHPDSVARERDTIQRDFNSKGVKEYLELATADERDLEAARVDHRAQVDAWEAEQAKREASAFRRLLPHAPRPALQSPQRRTTPHPFGGMSREEWVTYEAENLMLHGQTDLSEFTTNRVRAPQSRDHRTNVYENVTLPSVFDQPLPRDRWGELQDLTALVRQVEERSKQRPQTA